jgi:sulfur carrier protein
MPMQIILTGQAKTLSAAATVTQLLAELGLTERRVAVEVNQEIVPRSRHGEYRLKDDDRVEVVFAVGGG